MKLRRFSKPSLAFLPPRLWPIMSCCACLQVPWLGLRMPICLDGVLCTVTNGAYDLHELPNMHDLLYHIFLQMCIVLISIPTFISLGVPTSRPKCTRSDTTLASSEFLPWKSIFLFPLPKTAIIHIIYYSFFSFYFITQSLKRSCRLPGSIRYDGVLLQSRRRSQDVLQRRQELAAWLVRLSSTSLRR